MPCWGTSTGHLCSGMLLRLRRTVFLITWQQCLWQTQVPLGQALPRTAKRPQKSRLDTITFVPPGRQEHSAYFSFNTRTAVMCQQEHRWSISQNQECHFILQLRCISQLIPKVKRNVTLSFLCLTGKLGKQSRKLIFFKKKRLYGHRWPLTVALSLPLVTFRPCD